MATAVSSRQCTPSDTKGILSNGNVKLEERLDLLEFLDTLDGDACGDSTSSGGSDTPTVVGVSMLPAAAVGWNTAPDCSSSAPSRSVPYSSALEVAIDAERRGALITLRDEIPATLPWYLQAPLCLCACAECTNPRRHGHTMCPLSLARVSALARSLSVLWSRAYHATSSRDAALCAAREDGGDVGRPRPAQQHAQQ